MEVSADDGEEEEMDAGLAEAYRTIDCARFPRGPR